MHEGEYQEVAVAHAAKLRINTLLQAVKEAINGTANSITIRCVLCVCV